VLSSLQTHPQLVLMGDYNITWDDRDVWDPVGLAGTIHCTDAERALVFRVEGALHYLFYQGKPAVVRDAEIALLKDSLKYSIVAYDIQHVSPGQTLELQKGPFKGHTGTVSNIGKNRIDISIEALGIHLVLDRG
jgi:hypothetical protein